MSGRPDSGTALREGKVLRTEFPRAKHVGDIVGTCAGRWLGTEESLELLLDEIERDEPAEALH